MRDAIYLKECTLLFPRVAARHVVFLRDRHARHSRYPRARNPRKIDIRCVCETAYMSDTRYHDRETRIVRYSVLRLANPCDSLSNFARGDSSQRPRIMVIDGGGAFQSSLVTWNLTIRDAYLRCYNMTTLKHERLNHLSNMFTPSWYVTAGIIQNSWWLEFMGIHTAIPDRQDTCKIRPLN